MNNICKRFFKKEVDQKKSELIEIQSQIDSKLKQMREIRFDGTTNNGDGIEIIEDEDTKEVQGDYLYTDLTKLWKKQKKHKRFIRIFGT